MGDWSLNARRKPPTWAGLPDSFPVSYISDPSTLRPDPVPVPTASYGRRSGNGNGLERPLDLATAPDTLYRSWSPQDPQRGGVTRPQTIGCGRGQGHPGPAFSTLQTRLTLEPVPGLGTDSGTPQTPQITIDEFNDDRREPFPDYHSSQDFSFNDAFGEDTPASPLQAINRPRLSSGGAGLEACDLARTDSQTSSNLQDDAVSLANSSSSMGDASLALDTNIAPVFSPGTSFSDTFIPSSAPAPLGGGGRAPGDASPITSSFPWLSQTGDSSPALKPGSHFDPMTAPSAWAPHLAGTSPTSQWDHRNIPRSNPQQGALSAANATESRPAGWSQSQADSAFMEQYGSQFTDEDLSATLNSLNGQGLPHQQRPQHQQHHLLAGLGLIQTQQASGHGTIFSSAINDNPQARSVGDATDYQSLCGDMSPLQSLSSFDLSDTAAISYASSQPSLPTSPICNAPSATTRQVHLKVPTRSTSRRKASDTRPRAVSTSVLGTRPTVPTHPSRPIPAAKPMLIPISPQTKQQKAARSLPAGINNLSSDKKSAAASRGRRRGPMKLEAREEAKKTRNDKSICLRCKVNKQACHRPEDSPDAPCYNCERHAGTTKWPGPCIKACFGEIVLGGSLNYAATLILQLPSQDGSQFEYLQKDLPQELVTEKILQTLDAARGDVNIKVFHGGQPIYVLDLEKCFRHFKRVDEELRDKDSGYDLQTFLDQDIVKVKTKPDNWAAMIIDCDFRENSVALLNLIGESQQSIAFSYVSKQEFNTDGTAALEWALDPESPPEADLFIMASVLARVISRKVEVETYLSLQRELHTVNTIAVTRLVPLLLQLGRILVDLRWRSGCWALQSGASGGATPLSPASAEDPARQTPEMRVRELCRVLYFYFCYIRRRVPNGAKDIQSLQGMASVRQGCPSAVWDDFPSTLGESDSGFAAWMERGYQMVSSITRPGFHL